MPDNVSEPDVQSSMPGERQDKAGWAGVSPALAHGDRVTFKGREGVVVAVIPAGFRPYLGPPTKNWEVMRRHNKSPVRDVASYVVRSNGRLYWPQHLTICHRVL